MRSLVLILVITVLCVNCQGDQSEKWAATDLLEYGVPLSIMAPDSVDINKMNHGNILLDVTLKRGDNYYIQIYASDASTNDLAKLKAEYLAEVKTNKFFSKIISEEEKGFIYETVIDSLINYGFRYIHLQADREYIFQTGLTGTYSREEVEKMYDAVQQ